MFELLSLAMRYVFVALGALILLRIFLWFKKDANEYRKELKRLPDAGYIGEIRDPITGKSYPLPREGDLGKGFSCDIRITGNGVKRHHASLRFTPGKGLYVEPLRGNTIVMNGKRMRGGAYALNGSRITLGSRELMICFFMGVDAPHPARIETVNMQTEPAGESDADTAWGPSDGETVVYGGDWGPSGEDWRPSGDDWGPAEEKEYPVQKDRQLGPGFPPADAVWGHTENMPESGYPAYMYMQEPNIPAVPGETEAGQYDSGYVAHTPPPAVPVQQDACYDECIPDDWSEN